MAHKISLWKDKYNEILILGIISFGIEKYTGSIWVRKNENQIFS